jgi:hypothetical protein
MQSPLSPFVTVPHPCTEHSRTSSPRRCCWNCSRTLWLKCQAPKDRGTSCARLNLTDTHCPLEFLQNFWSSLAYPRPVVLSHECLDSIPSKRFQNLDRSLNAVAVVVTALACSVLRHREHDLSCPAVEPMRHQIPRAIVNRDLAHTSPQRSIDRRYVHALSLSASLSFRSLVSTIGPVETVAAAPRYLSRWSGREAGSNRLTMRRRG